MDSKGKRVFFYCTWIFATLVGGILVAAWFNSMAVELVENCFK